MLIFRNEPFYVGLSMKQHLVPQQKRPDEMTPEEREEVLRMQAEIKQALSNAAKQAAMMIGSVVANAAATAVKNAARNMASSVLSKLMGKKGNKRR